MSLPFSNNTFAWEQGSTFDIDSSSLREEHNLDKLYLEYHHTLPESMVEHAHNTRINSKTSKTLMAIDCTAFKLSYFPLLIYLLVLVAEAQAPLPSLVVTMIDKDQRMCRVKPQITALRKRRVVIEAWKAQKAKEKNGTSTLTVVDSDSKSITLQNKRSSPRYHPYSASSPIKRSSEDDVIDGMSKMSIIATSFQQNECVMQGRDKEPLKDIYLGSRTKDLPPSESTLGNKINSVPTLPVPVCGLELPANSLRVAKMSLDEERHNFKSPLRTYAYGLEVGSHKYGDDDQWKRRSLNLWG